MLVCTGGTILWVRSGRVGDVVSWSWYRPVGADGAPLPLGAALLRYVAYFVSAAPLAMGFIMAGLRRDKRALHDLIAGSRVDRIRARPRARAEAPPAQASVTPPVA